MEIKELKYITLITLKCKKNCGKIIRSSYKKQAEFNRKEHERFCQGKTTRKKRDIKEVCGCGKAVMGYSKKQAETDLRKHKQFCGVK